MNIFQLIEYGSQLPWYEKLPVFAIPAILGITLHEVAHGWVAKQFGDMTAHQMGRITVNPIKHIDPIGTIVVPAILAITTPFVFGWAKPVPVNPERLDNPKRDMAFVALAGPGANFLMILGWGLVFKLGIVGLLLPFQQFAQYLLLMASAGIVINALLMVLNLIPMPPLDGGRILKSVVPDGVGHWLDRIEPLGILIIVGLLVSGVLGQYMWPAIIAVVFALGTLLGIS